MMDLQKISRCWKIPLVWIVLHLLGLMKNAAKQAFWFSSTRDPGLGMEPMRQQNRSDSNTSKQCHGVGRWILKAKFWNNTSAIIETDGWTSAFRQDMLNREASRKTDSLDNPSPVLVPACSHSWVGAWESLRLEIIVEIIGSVYCWSYL